MARSMSPLLLGVITRQLRRMTGLKKPVYLVGGAVTDGASLRDLDFVVGDKADIEIVKQTLGKYAAWSHFILQNKPPAAATYIRFTGKEAPATGKHKGRISKTEFAGS